MFKHDLEKIGSAVSKHCENIKGFGISAKNLAENPKKLAGFDPQDPQLFGCMNKICRHNDFFFSFLGHALLCTIQLTNMNTLWNTKN